jgi:hypothetical protein
VSHSQIAVRLIALVLTVFFLGGAGLDALSAFKGWPGIAERLQGWTGNHPLLAAGLAALTGALLGHFFFWARS